MQIFELPKKSSKQVILALGAESAGNFSVFVNNRIHFSENFGDLLLEKNYKKFQTVVLDFLKKNKLKPNVILTDLHPLYKTTIWGAELAKKFSAKHIQVQHHLAHIFSAVGDFIIAKGTCPVKRNSAFYGVALDGTGYGLDDKIWGGEIFLIQKSKIKNQNYNLKFKSNLNSRLNIVRIGKLEDHIMIGGDLAVREPARMLISILDKFSIPRLRDNFQFQNFQTKKEFIYHFVKKYYTKNQFELLYNQLEQNFNCVETSSTGRILDAVSIFLGFCGNKRNYKHEPIDLLERNSAIPYNNLKPKIIKIYNKELRIINYELCTTYLFEYLIKNIQKDKRRLAATAQLYIAEGLHKIIKKIHNTKYIIHNTYAAGGISNNKIISDYFSAKGVYANKKIPRGDGGISFGQVVYYLPAKNLYKNL